MASHGQHPGSLGMGNNGSFSASGPDYMISYFALPDSRGLVYAHIAFMIIAWIFVLPVAVMLSIARSKLSLLIQLGFTLLNAVGIIFVIIYNQRTPDLYPNNAHHSIGWMVTIFLLLQLMIRLIAQSASTTKRHLTMNSGQSNMRPIQSFGYHAPVQYFSDGPDRFSNDSRRGTELGTTSLRSSSSSSFNGDESCLHDPMLSFTDDVGQCDTRFSAADFHTLLSPSSKASTTKSGTFFVAPPRIKKCLDILHQTIDRIILPVGFITLTTGVATYGRLFEGQAIFNGLAHWIKGGVFFWLGSVTLARWSGCFAELGWAWNLTPLSKGREKRRFSAEFVESGLIFFYGSSNIFLEHLGSWGREWGPDDLEHLAITVLFMGGGLCGMLVESTAVRSLLNATALAADRDTSDHVDGAQEWHTPQTYKVSLNPVPALVIFLLGVMMSSHHQADLMSSMVHKQWGNLLLGASFARGITYVLLYLRPPRSVYPSRPPTELLAAFGLIAGGIMFMASSSDTIQGMINYELDAMFMYTISMGIVGLLMAWELVVLAIKGWALKEQFRSRASKC